MTKIVYEIVEHDGGWAVARAHSGVAEGDGFVAQRFGDGDVLGPP
jgi:hypothetical protein